MTPNLQILLIKRHMKISTKMKDHSAAVNETQNQQTPLKIHLKIHENQDQNENHSAALIHKEWHFGLKKHEGKRKFRLLSMPHWPDSLQLGEPTRCSLLNLLPFSCCFLLCVWAFVVTLRAAEWITSSLGSFMCLQMSWCWIFFVTGSSWIVYR